LYSKINLGELMNRRSGDGSGAGEEPVGDPGLPGGPAPDPGTSAGEPSGSESAGAPDPGLTGFVKGGVWDSMPPSAALAAALEGAAGTGWRCEGGSHEEIVGAVRAAAALESWACAAKLGLIRAAIREDDDGLGGEYHGDLPDAWSRSLTTDVGLALAMSPVSAENLMQTAWDLGATLPGIGALLEDGTLTYPKARAVNDALELLSEEDRARAEAMIAPRVAGKTYGQVDKLAAQAAITVDPELAERTREQAERNRARVTLRRDRSGAASLSGCDLPPAETLAAHAATCARAQVYKDSGAFPGVLMDQFRAMAYLDLMNEISAEARITAGPPDEGLGAPGEAAFRDEPEPDDPGPAAPDGSGGSDCPCRECDGRCAPHDAPAPDDDGPDDGPGDSDDNPDEDGPHDSDDGGPDDGGPDDDGPDDDGPDDDGPDDDGPGKSDDDLDDVSPDGGDGGAPGQRPPAAPPPPPTSQPPPQPLPTPSSPWSAPPSSAAPPKLTDLTIPLADLLSQARRPGESHGFGPLDPALCRALAALAAASPHTTACVTVTDENGYAIGHGCLRSGRRKAALPGAPDPPLTALPAALNLTIPATRLAKLLANTGPPGRPAPPGPASPTGWALTPPGAPDQQGPPGDPDWLAIWTITVPSGLQYAVPLEPVPTHHCDHRRESLAYEPNDALRHLVQIRDRECTLPTCSRPAKESDFEHAIPYEQGGRTCGCNAGARSRACHQVKQSPGWKVTQPKPGWHQWETPSGRTYTQEPKRYPV
jgi:Domain of unknown function (DUF222)